MHTATGDQAPESDAALLQRLREREQQLRFALRGGDLGLWDWDVVTGRLSVNERWCTMLGLDPQGATPTIETWNACVHPDDVPRLEEIVRTVLLAPDGEHFEVEVRARHADGRWLWILDKGAVVARGPDGAPLRVVGTHMDVTARKDAELSRRRAEERLRFALDAAGIVEWSADLDTGRVHLSPQAEALLGPAPPAGWTTGALLERVDPRDRAEVAAAWSAGVAATGEIDVECRALLGTGASRWLWLKGRCHAVAPGGPARFDGILVDVDARRTAEEERRALQRSVLDAASFEQQRIGMDLHDGLGQELTGLSLLLAALARQPPDDPVRLREQLETLAQAASRCVRTTRSIAHGLAPIEVDVGGLDSALRRLADSMHDVAHLQTEVSAQGLEALDATTAVNVYRIVQEALANAAKHGRASRAVVAARVTEGDLVLTVADDGVGLGPAAAAGSAGLGLKIMAYRAHVLHGRLDLQPSPGGGTTVRLTCPAVAEAVAARR